MMIRLPRWLIRNVSREEYEELLDWRLSTTDVALIMDVSYHRVLAWGTRGWHGWKLRYRSFSKRPGSPRAYRLVDIEEFANVTNRGIDYTLLHPALQREWGVGIFGREDVEHDTLGTLTNREELHRDED